MESWISRLPRQREREVHLATRSDCPVAQALGIGPTSNNSGSALKEVTIGMTLNLRADIQQGVQTTHAPVDSALIDSTFLDGVPYQDAAPMSLSPDSALSSSTSFRLGLYNEHLFTVDADSDVELETTVGQYFTGNANSEVDLESTVGLRSPFVNFAAKQLFDALDELETDYCPKEQSLEQSLLDIMDHESSTKCPIDSAAATAVVPELLMSEDDEPILSGTVGSASGIPELPVRARVELEMKQLEVPRTKSRRKKVYTPASQQTKAWKKKRERNNLAAAANRLREKEAKLAAKHRHLGLRDRNRHLRIKVLDLEAQLTRLEEAKRKSEAAEELLDSFALSHSWQS